MNQKIERREFLKKTGSGAAACLLGGAGVALAQQSKPKKAVDLSPRTLVSVFLRGGQDALNALVPYGEKHYYDLRSSIAIAPPGQANGALKLDAMFGFHPSMKSLMPFYESGKLAPIINVGSPHPTRSHFDAQDFMEYAAPGLRSVSQGWLNRYLEVSSERAKLIEKEKGFSIRALAMQNLLPRSLRGPCPVLAVPNREVAENESILGDFEKLNGGGEQGKMMPERKEDEDVVRAMGLETIRALRCYREAMRKPRPGSGASYGSGWFGARLRSVASLIHADVGLEVACVDIGGWDHHQTEGGAEGTISRMLKELSDGLAGFATDLGDKLEQALVLVMTEFGRNCDENGTRGTDHGRGGLMLALGGGVKGGKVLGEWRGLEPKVLADGRDLPIAVDFRDVFVDSVKNHMKCELPREFLPYHTPKPVKGLFA